MLKAVIGTAVALAVVGGGGYFADQAVRDAAENQVAAQIQAQLGLPAPPEVELGGFPFSLALLTRSVPDATASASVVPLPVAGHDADFTDVQLTTGRISLSDEQVQIAEVSATAELSYDELAKIAEVPVGYAGEGRLELRYEVAVLGRTFSVAVSALPRLDVDEAVIRLTGPRLDLAGVDVGLNLSQEQLDALVQPIDVQLEHGLRITELTPGDAAIGVRIDGDNFTLPLR